jgi:hypothetical protein
MCQKKKKKKTTQEQLNQTPEYEDFNKETGSSKEPSREPAGPLSKGIALSKKIKKKFNNQHPSPGWKPRPRLSAVACTKMIVFFFFFFLYFLEEPALALLRQPAGQLPTGAVFPQ